MGSCKPTLLHMTSGGCALCDCEPQFTEDCKLFAQLRSETLATQSLSPPCHSSVVCNMRRCPEDAAELVDFRQTSQASGALDKQKIDGSISRSTNNTAAHEKLQHVPV